MLSSINKDFIIILLLSLYIIVLKHREMLKKYADLIGISEDSDQTALLGAV